MNCFDEANMKNDTIDKLWFELEFFDYYDSPYGVKQFWNKDKILKYYLSGDLLKLLEQNGQYELIMQVKKLQRLKNKEIVLAELIKIFEIIYKENTIRVSDKLKREEFIEKFLNSLK